MYGEPDIWTKQKLSDKVYWYFEFETFILFSFTHSPNCAIGVDCDEGQRTMDDSSLPENKNLVYFLYLYLYFCLYLYLYIMIRANKKLVTAPYLVERIMFWGVCHINSSIIRKAHLFVTRAPLKTSVEENAKTVKRLDQFFVWFEIEGTRNELPTKFNIYRVKERADKSHSEAYWICTNRY